VDAVGTIGPPANPPEKIAYDNQSADVRDGGYEFIRVRVCRKANVRADLSKRARKENCQPEEPIATTSNGTPRATLSSSTAFEGFFGS